ncbi:Riboflavin kinase [Fusarium oxysporum f. sp. albedinis]|nr:Riboflavin kinase [Fusarium oxysporum f. sp. albedinis]
MHIEFLSNITDISIATSSGEVLASNSSQSPSQPKDGKHNACQHGQHIAHRKWLCMRTIESPVGYSRKLLSPLVQALCKGYTKFLTGYPMTLSSPSVWALCDPLWEH